MRRWAFGVDETLLQAARMVLVRADMTRIGFQSAKMLMRHAVSCARAFQFHPLWRGSLMRPGKFSSKRPMTVRFFPLFRHASSSGCLLCFELPLYVPARPSSLATCSVRTICLS